MTDAPAAVVLDGVSLTPGGVVAAARHGAPVTMDGAARARNAAAWRTARALAERTVVYGRTTGVGALASEAVPHAGGARDPTHDLRLLRSHAAGTGDLAAAEVARAMLVVRANQIGVGGAGISPPLLDEIVAVLNAGLAPAVHETGDVGTGDLTSLADAGLALVGEGAWLLGATRPPAALAAGDGLVLLSSNARTLGEASLAAVDLATLLDAADVVAGLSCEAVGTGDAPYDQRVHAARPHAGQIASAARLRAVIGPRTGTDSRLQDPLCFRCVPQVHGAARDAREGLDRVLAVDLNAATENPLIIAGDEVALPNGNFSAVTPMLVLDHARAALAHVGALSTRRLSSLLDPALTGLSAYLACGPAGSSGALALEYAATASLGALQAAATAMGAPTAVLAHGIEDHAPLAPLAAAQTRLALRHAQSVLGAELVAAVRALRLADRAPASAAGRDALARAGALLPAELADRPLSADLQAAAAAITDGTLS